MNGDGFGSPPWGPAEPVPERADTQALPGLGPASGPGEQSGGSQDGHGNRSSRHQAGTAGQDSEAEPERDSSGTGRHGRHSRRAKGEGEGKRRRSFWRELPVLIAVALVLALVIKAFVVQAFWIPSAVGSICAASMEHPGASTRGRVRRTKSRTMPCSPAPRRWRIRQGGGRCS